MRGVIFLWLPKLINKTLIIFFPDNFEVPGEYFHTCFSIALTGFLTVPSLSAIALPVFYQMLRSLGQKASPSKGSHAHG